MATSKIKTVPERTALIKEFLVSGMSKIAWCEKKGIPYSTFGRWMKLYDAGQEPVKFIALTTQQASGISAGAKEPVQSDTMTKGLSVEIGVCRIHITEETSVSLLTKLVKAVNNANV